MLILKPDETVRVPVLVQAPDNGAHGAVIIKKATLTRNDGTTVDLTPSSTSNILREEGHAVSPANEETVSGSPTFSSGGGTGGKDVYTITTSAAHGFTPGMYIRSKSGSGAIYKVDAAPTSTTLKVFAATGELDILDTHVIEEVIPEGWFRGYVPVTYSNLAGLRCDLEIEIDGLTSATRANKPYVSSIISLRKVDALRPWVDSGSINIV